MKTVFAVLLLLLSVKARAYTRQDTLRGSNGRGRAWWDVRHYDLNVSLDSASRFIQGQNAILFQVAGAPAADSIQIDLQDAMVLDSAFIEAVDVRAAAPFAPERGRLPYSRDGNVYWLLVPGAKGRFLAGSTHRLTLVFHGAPREAVHPPWDGGFIRTRDGAKHPWSAVACQGLAPAPGGPAKTSKGTNRMKASSSDFGRPSGTAGVS